MGFPPGISESMVSTLNQLIFDFRFTNISANTKKNIKRDFLQNLRQRKDGKSMRNSRKSCKRRKRTMEKLKSRSSHRKGLPVVFLWYKETNSNQKKRSQKNQWLPNHWWSQMKLKKWKRLAHIMGILLKNMIGHSQLQRSKCKSKYLKERQQNSWRSKSSPSTFL